MNAIRRSTSAPLLALALASCSSNPPAPASISAAAPAAADYRALAARPGGRVFSIDPAASRIRIYAFRAGHAAFAGHDHILSARNFSGDVFLPDKAIADAQFDLSFRLDQLTIDDPAMRAEAGGAFASVLDAGDIAGTREHLLGADSFDAAHFPLVQIHSAAVDGELPKLVATVQMTLHGQSRSLLIPIDVQVDGDTLRGSGSFAFRQTDFGVKPYSVLGGLLSVQDEVSVDFTLIGHPAGN